MYPRVKNIGGRQYVYLVQGSRKGKKVRQESVSYLGPLSVLTFGIPESIRKKVQRKIGSRSDINWDDLNAKIAKLPMNFDEFAKSKNRRSTLKLREVSRLSLPLDSRRKARVEPPEIFNQRIAGELETIARLSKNTFESMFEQIGPLEYRLRRK